MSDKEKIELENASLRQQLILAQSAVLQYQYKEVTALIESLRAKQPQAKQSNGSNADDVAQMFPHPM